MSYCPNCGVEVSEQHSVCWRCGTSLSRKPAAPSGRVGARQQEMAELDRIRAYFEPKRMEYSELHQNEARINYLTGKRYNSLRITGGIMVLIAVFFLTHLRDETEFLGFGLFFGIPGAGILALYFHMLKAKQNEILALNERQQLLQTELSQYCDAYGPCPLGVEYTDPAVLDILYDLLRSGRADSLKEAVNLWLDDIHKATMQSTMNATAEAAADAAHSARASAVMGALNFMSRL